MHKIVALFILLALVSGQAAGAIFHSADQDRDAVFSLSELLRLIQFYNSGSLYCDATTEDGFASGAGEDKTCAPHATDYAPVDWKISLSELLRAIQFYNGGGYYVCDGSEDGFCARNSGLPRQNVVFLILDTLKSEQIGKQRDGKTILPFISEFAAGGTQFTHAWSPGSWTHPGMAGLFTGKHSERFAEITAPEGAGQSTHFILPESEETIVEWLAKYGYDAWGMQTNANGQAVWGYAQGFPEGQFSYQNFIPAAMVTDHVLATQAQWKEPFFVFAQYIDAHGPYFPPVNITFPFEPEPPLNAYDSVVLDTTKWRDFSLDVLEAFYGAHPQVWANLSPNGVAVMQTRYDKDCHYLDSEVRRLVEDIESKYPNTVFVFVSDHGESLFDRDIIGHGHTVYEEQLRVPFIFRGPRVPAQVIGRRVNTLGLLPTLAGILELSRESHWEGVDLMVDAPPAPQFAYTNSTFKGITIEASCVVDGDLKYIRDPHHGPPQLYDLAIDPGERTDLAAARPGDLARLSALLDAHLLAVGK